MCLPDAPEDNESHQPCHDCSVYTLLSQHVSDLLGIGIWLYLSVLSYCILHCLSRPYGARHAGRARDAHIAPEKITLEKCRTLWHDSPHAVLYVWSVSGYGW